MRGHELFFRNPGRVNRQRAAEADGWDELTKEAEAAEDVAEDPHHEPDQPYDLDSLRGIFLLNKPPDHADQTDRPEDFGKGHISSSFQGVSQPGAASSVAPQDSSGRALRSGA